MHPGLFAVHISDGVLTPTFLAGGFASAGVLLALALWKLGEDRVARIGLFTAAFFVASQVHIPAGVGSVHLMLNGVIGVVLRRFAPLAIAVGLLLQALLFGHGGLLALGVNTCVLSLPALAAGYGYPLLRRAARAEWSPLVCGFIVGLIAGLMTVSLNLAALLVGGKDDYEWPARVLLIAYAVLIPVEATLTGIVIQYLERVKPEWLGYRDSPSGNTSSNGTSH